jgi:hypothetical protein
MTIPAQNLSKARKVAVGVVLANVGLTAVAAIALPESLHGLLPVLGIGLPFLSMFALQAAFEPHGHGNGSAHA